MNIEQEINSLLKQIKNFKFDESDVKREYRTKIKQKRRTSIGKIPFHLLSTTQRISLQQSTVPRSSLSNSDSSYSCLNPTPNSCIYHLLESETAKNTKYLNKLSNEAIRCQIHRPHRSYLKRVLEIVPSKRQENEIKDVFILVRDIPFFKVRSKDYQIRELAPMAYHF